VIGRNARFLTVRVHLVCAIMTRIQRGLVGIGQIRYEASAAPNLSLMPGGADTGAGLIA